MKISYKLVFGTLLLFGIITLTTMSLDYNADGADQYGFPLNFYTKVSGYNMETNKGGTSIRFSLLALLIDIVIAFVSSWIIFKLIKKFNKKVNV